MTIRDIVTIGNPALLQRSAEITEFATPYLYELIADLTETQRHYKGVGIAAPQIGEFKRVILFGFEEPSLRYPDIKPFPISAIINPEFTVLGTETEVGWEGCLSVPVLRGGVRRHQHIHYSGFDVAGRPISGELTGFIARIIQHEVDHLDGYLFPHRLEKPEYLGTTDELSAINFDLSALDRVKETNLD